MAHSFGFCADRRTFTCLTARSRSVGASNETARYAYSREIDMQARLKTRRTDSVGVGIFGGIAAFCFEVHAAMMIFCARLNESCRLIKHVEGCGDAV